MPLLSGAKACPSPHRPPASRQKRAFASSGFIVLDPETGDVLSAKFWVYHGERPIQSFDSFEAAQKFFRANAARYTA